MNIMIAVSKKSDEDWPNFELFISYKDGVWWVVLWWGIIEHLDLGGFKEGGKGLEFAIEMAKYYRPYGLPLSVEIPIRLGLSVERRLCELRGDIGAYQKMIKEK